LLLILNVEQNNEIIKKDNTIIETLNLLKDKQILHEELLEKNKTLESKMLAILNKNSYLTGKLDKLEQKMNENQSEINNEDEWESFKLRRLPLESIELSPSIKLLDTNNDIPTINNIKSEPLIPESSIKPTAVCNFHKGDYAFRQK